MKRGAIIYKGSFQYGAVNIFADALAEGFSELGLQPHVIDLTDLANFTASLKKALDADCGLIVAFGGIGSTVKRPDGSFLHDALGIPYVAALVDHPGHALAKFEPSNIVISCYDESHLDYLKLRYGGAKRAFHLPHGGCASRNPFKRAYEERPLGILYPASFIDPEGILAKIKALPDVPRRVVMAASEEILSRDSVPIHKAIMSVGEGFGVDFASGGQKVFSFVMDQTLPLVELYTRAKKRLEALNILDKAGVALEICGSNWPEGIFKRHRVRGPVPFDEVLNLMSQSKVVINTVMVPGSHERVLSGALCGAAVLSDFTEWMSSEFKDGDEMILYKWTERESLPQAAASLLGNPSRAASIASKGMDKARGSHTWAARAKELLSRLGEAGA